MTDVSVNERDPVSNKLEDEGQHLRLYCDVYSVLGKNTCTHTYYILMHTHI